MADLRDLFSRPAALAIACIVMLVVAGAYLRLVSLSEQPYWMDEGFTVNAVLSVLEHGDTTLDSGEHYTCPTYCYPTVALAGIFGLPTQAGENAFTYRLLAALAGSAFIAVIFFIARSWFGTSAALIASAFTAFSYFQIAWSRQARWYTLFELFFWLALFFFYQALYGERRRTRIVYGTLCALATALAVQTHGLGLLLPAIFAAWLLLDRLFISRNTTHLIALGAALAGASALFLLTDRGQMLVGHISFFWGAPYYIGYYLFTYWLFIALAVSALWYSRAEKAVWFVVLAVAAYALPLMTLTETIHYRYLFHLTPALFMLAALGIETIRTRAKHVYARAGVVVATLAIFLSVGGGVLVPQTFYFLEADDPEQYPNLSYYAYTPQPDWNAAYEYVATNKTEDEIVISSMPQFNKIFLDEPGYWIKYDYLGADNKEELITNDKEYYVGAKVVDDLAELQSITASAHGFIVLDYMATDDRLSEDMLDYIWTLEQVFHKRENSYSEVWVFRF